MPPFPNSPSPSRPLTARVQARVDAAAARLSGQNLDGTPRETIVDVPKDSPLELRALRCVFRDLGRRQRNVRRRTGQAPSPVVRQVALAFRAHPTLSGLVLVAAALDDVGLLFW